MKISAFPEISGLSTPEKIIFVEELWDSIASNDKIPVPESHKVELEKRLSKAHGHVMKKLSLAEFQTRVEKRK